MRSLTKIYAFSFFWMFMLIIPVMVPYYQGLGLSMAEVFQLQAIFGLGITLCEAPAGYLCDWLGRRRALIAGGLLNGLAFSWLAYAQSFGGLVVFELTLSIGMALVSGADVALIYDTIEHESRAGLSNERTGKRRALGDLLAAQVTGESIAALLGGLVAALSLRHVAVANAVASWIPLAIALTVQDPPRERPEAPTGHLRCVLDLTRQMLARDGALRLVFFNLTCWTLAAGLASWVFQKYWQEQGISLAWFGLLWAAYNLSVGFVGKQVHRLERAWSARTLVLIMGLASVAGFFGMGLLGGLAGLLCGGLFCLSRGVAQVLLREAFNDRVPGSLRATANSIQAAGYRLGFALVGPLVGYGLDVFGTERTLVALGALFGAAFVGLVIPLLRQMGGATATEEVLGIADAAEG